MIEPLALASFRHARRAAAALVLFVPWWLSGCGQNQPLATVPVKENAAQQYRYAVEYRTQRHLDLIVDKKKLASEREVIRQTFQKVYENFPDERTFTPLAKLEVIEMDGGLDNQRVAVSTRQVHRTIGELKKLAGDYPEYVFIQAKCLFQQGQLHKRLGEFPEAQKCFKEVVDKYSRNPERTIAALAKEAAFYYNKTYVNQK